MKNLTPFIPVLAVKVTRCPTAFAAPSTGQISAAHANAIREHNDAIEKAREEKGRPPPITYGKRRPKSLFGPASTARDYQQDIADDLPGGYSVNG